MSADQKRIEREWFALAALRDRYRSQAWQEQRSGHRNEAILTMRKVSKIGVRCKALEEEFRALCRDLPSSKSIP